MANRPFCLFMPLTIDRSVCIVKECRRKPANARKPQKSASVIASSTPLIACSIGRACGPSVSTASWPEADAAKASLYQHFGGKDQLVASSLERRTVEARAKIEAYLADTPPSQRALKFFDWVVAWAESKDFRGCPLQHTVTRAHRCGAPGARHCSRSASSGSRSVSASGRRRRE